MSIDQRFGVLVVCHANLCRSPMGERLARKALADRLGAAAELIEVTSAGTHAVPGRAMHPYAAQVLLENAADPGGFRTRRLTADLVRGADLVLTATRGQRSACVTLEPAAVRRTFTIRQFGRYAAALPADRPAGDLLDELAVVRAHVPVVAAADDDLDDPVGLPVETFRRCAAGLRPVADVLAGVIAATPPAGARPRPAQHGR